MAVALSVLPLAQSAATADVLDDIGFRDLYARDGGLRSAPGAGVPVAQVEVPAAGPPAGTTAYAPDVSGGSFPDKVFVYRSGAASASGHATDVARSFYGYLTSPAPAVPSITLFSAETFVQGVLRTGRSARGPGGVGASVVNNSWIAAYPDEATNVDAVRRLDNLIHRDDVLVFNAVGNAATDPFPKLLATSYNGVSVGTLAGSHGPVVFDAGRRNAGARIKPDLVVDVSTTSTATAFASGAGALLRGEAKARNLPAGELAVKAVLMAGADRDATWRRGRPTGKDNATSPLDYQQGAGRLRVDQSFDILVAGKHAAGAAIPAAAGWDYARTPRNRKTVTYPMHVGQTLPDWDAVLTWNREIDGARSDGAYSTATRLADFDLALYRNKRGTRRLVAYSDSPYDNVESLQLTNLPAGDYSLVLTTDVRSYYSLAWYADPTRPESSSLLASSLAEPAAAVTAPFVGTGLNASAVPEPSSLLLLAPLLALGRRRARH